MSATLFGFVYLILSVIKSEYAQTLKLQRSFLPTPSISCSSHSIRKTVDMWAVKWKASNQVFVVSEPLDTSVLKSTALGKRVTSVVPVTCTSDAEHFVTFPDFKLAAM